jgi:hypothetical protein
MFTCEVFDKEPNEFCIRSQMENRQEQIATNMQEMSIYSIQIDHRTPKSRSLSSFFCLTDIFCGGKD